MNATLILVSLLPENLLLLGILALVFLEIVPERTETALTISVVALGTALEAALYLATAGFSATPFPGQLVVDTQGYVGKAILIVLALPVILIARTVFPGRTFHILALSGVYGACLMMSAQSFLTLFLGIELLSLPVYTLVVLAMRRPQSAEAALKYLILGGAASAILLMGAAIIQAWSGTLGFEGFARALHSSEPLPLAGVALVTCAFFVKAAIVPFHGWAPDAYEGATVPVTAYMATIVKSGVILAAVRLFSDVKLQGETLTLIATLPLISILWGNLAALRQDNFRRMIAYSSIAHAGYLFYAFLGDGSQRFQSVAFYLLAYGVMNVLAFSMLPWGKDDASSDKLANLKGLYHRQPYAAIAIAVAMLSLSGLPPFPGFIGKFLIFRNVIAAGYTTYAVLGLVASYIGIYFYLRVVQYLFMDPEEKTATRGAPDALAIGAGAACLVGGIVMAVLPGWVLGYL